MSRKRSRSEPPDSNGHEEEREEMRHYDKTHPQEKGYQGRPSERFHKNVISGLKTFIGVTAPKIQKVRATGRKISKAARKRSRVMEDNFAGSYMPVPNFGKEAGMSFGMGLHNMGADWGGMSFSDPFDQPKRGRHR